MDLWVNKKARLNARKTQARTSIWQVPLNILCGDTRAVPTEEAVGDVDKALSADDIALLATKKPATGRGCNMCGLVFQGQAAQAEMVSHFKSSFHQMNLRRQLRGLPAKAAKATKTTKNGEDEESDGEEGGDNDSDENSSESSEGEGEGDEESTSTSLGETGT